MLQVDVFFSVCRLVSKRYYSVSTINVCNLAYLSKSVNHCFQSSQFRNDRFSWFRPGRDSWIVSAFTELKFPPRVILGWDVGLFIRLPHRLLLFSYRPGDDLGDVHPTNLKIDNFHWVHRKNNMGSFNIGGDIPTNRDENRPSEPSPHNAPSSPSTDGAPAAYASSSNPLTPEATPARFPHSTPSHPPPKASRPPASVQTHCTSSGIAL